MGCKNQGSIKLKQGLLIIILLFLSSCTENQKKSIISGVRTFRSWEPYELSGDAYKVGALFHKRNFHQKFPQYKNMTYSYIDKLGEKKYFTVDKKELDALTHFYGNILFQENYGTALTLLAGLANELYGSIILGNKWNSQKIDLKNNYYGLTSYNSFQLNVLNQLLEGKKVDEDILHQFLIYGLKHSEIPPLTEQHWRPWQ